ncbi:MAG: DUF4783 domain-containing protein [Bacteroidota bacterium]
MKNLRNISAIVLIMFGLSQMSIANTSSDALINEIASAIKKGSAGNLSNHFASSIELLLPGNEGTYSRKQAEVMLRSFFNKNQSNGFSVNHRGSSRDGSKYAIGTYKAKNGKSFRAYYLVKKVSNSFQLHQLQFEEQ